MEKFGIIQALDLMYEKGILHVFAFAMGASVGSFLNVVIYRWPEEMSIVTPGSHCPACKTPIPWYLNIPILSWIMLRGKCKFCGVKISPRYMVVELAGGIWGVLCLMRFGPSIPCLAVFSLGSALLAASVIDLQHRLLPDVITLGSIPVGVALSLLPQAWAPMWPVPWYESLLGIVLGGGIFLAVLLIFQLITGKEGMGWGDVKLMAGMGALVGYAAVPAVILISSVLGILSWAVLALMKKADKEFMVPFGPFISLAAIMVLFFWDWLEKNWVIFHLFRL